MVKPSRNFDGCGPAATISSFYGQIKSGYLSATHPDAPEWNGTAGRFLLADSITPKVSRDDLGDIKCAVDQN
jgi:hypothetical protein